MAHVFWFLFILSATLSTLAQPQPVTPGPKSFVTDHVSLYQPDAVLRQRISAAKELAGYIEQLQNACAEHFEAAGAGKTPETLQIVVAVRPNKRARVWFITSKKNSGGHEHEALKKKLEAIDPLDVHGGPVTFAIAARIAGDNSEFGDTGSEPKPPIPAEWTEAVKDLKPPLQLPDSFLDAVWPDKAN